MDKGHILKYRHQTHGLLVNELLPFPNKSRIFAANRVETKGMPFVAAANQSLNEILKLSTRPD